MTQCLVNWKTNVKYFHYGIEWSIKRINYSKNGDIKSLNIGKKRFKHLPTVFSDISHLNARWTNKIDGLLGYEILSRQKLIMSINNKKLIFIE